MKHVSNTIDKTHKKHRNKMKRWHVFLVCAGFVALTFTKVTKVLDAQPTGSPQKPPSPKPKTVLVLLLMPAETARVQVKVAVWHMFE